MDHGARPNKGLDELRKDSCQWPSVASRREALSANPDETKSCPLGGEATLLDFACLTGSTTHLLSPAALQSTIPINPSGDKETCQFF